MVADFPKTLFLLRQEKGISQRTAAASLNVSQALLSHYENGAREPGLAFLLRAASFYAVSTDYLLGRTAHRDNIKDSPAVAPTEGDSECSRFTRERRHILSDTATLLFELMRRTEDLPLIDTAFRYLAFNLYKLARHLSAVPASQQSSEAFPENCELQIKKAEFLLRRHTGSLQDGDFPALSKAFKSEFPALSPSFDALTAFCENDISSTARLMAPQFDKDTNS